MRRAVYGQDEQPIKDFKPLRPPTRVCQSMFTNWCVCVCVFRGEVSGLCGNVEDTCAQSTRWGRGNATASQVSITHVFALTIGYSMPEMHTLFAGHIPITLMVMRMLTCMVQAW